MIRDCFLFFNELDLLDIRLHTLENVVDRFVLVESNETFSGNPKPLYFAENKDMFEKYLDRIDYVLVNNLPRTNNFWVREGEQRNAIMNGLKDAKQDDLILISDLDEIPRPKAIQYVSQTGISIFIQDYYMYYLNMRSPDEALWFLGTRAVHMDEMTTPQDVRNWGAFRQPIKDKFCIFNGGWHFSYLGGAESIKYKLESSSESQLPGGLAADYDDLLSIHQRLAHGRDVLGIRAHHWQPVPIDGSYPEYIIENQDHFSDLIFGSDGSK